MRDALRGLALFGVGLTVGLALIGCATMSADDPRAANPGCGPANDVAYGVITEFGHRPVGVGGTESGYAVLLSDGDTWSIIEISQDGSRGCLIAHGHLFQKKGPRA